MKRQDYSGILLDLQSRTPVFKAFYFILEKLDFIHEILTNNQGSKFKHSYLAVHPDENKAFLEIQKTLSSIIHILSSAKSQQTFPQQTSLQKTNTYNKEDITMDQNQISVQPNKNNNLFQFSMQENYDVNKFKNQKQFTQNNDLSMFSQNNIEQSYLSQSMLVTANPYEPIQNSILNQSQQVNHRNKTIIKVLARGNICQSGITAITGLPNNHFVVGSNNGCLIYCLFSCNQQMNIITLCSQQIHRDSVSYICALNSNTIVSLSRSGKLSVLTIISNTFKLVFKSQVHNGIGNKVIKYNENAVITCGNDGSIKVINFQIQNTTEIVKLGGDISSIIKLQKIRNNILVLSRADKRCLYFWNLDNSKLENCILNIYTTFPDGLVEISPGRIAVANCVSPYSIIIFDVFKYITYKEIKVPQVQMNKSLYTMGNDFCCIVDNMYFQISTSSFKLEIRHSDKNIKQKGGFIVFDDGKHIGIPNPLNGIDIYKI